MRKILATLLICLPFCIPQPGHASLNDRYPTDEYGQLVDPEINALASAIVGRPITAYCAPSLDGALGWTIPTGYSFDDGETWTYVFDDEIYIDGALCGVLDKLLHYSDDPSFFGRDIEIRPLAKLGTRTKHSKRDRAFVLNSHTASAGDALIALVHESLHVKLGSIDEGLVECTAMHNLWPTLASMHLPSWLNKLILRNAWEAHRQSDAEYLTVC